MLINHLEKWWQTELENKTKEFANYHAAASISRDYEKGQEHLMCKVYILVLIQQNNAN